VSFIFSDVQSAVLYPSRAPQIVENPARIDVYGVTCPILPPLGHHTTPPAASWTDRPSWSDMEMTNPLFCVDVTYGSSGIG
jgi:hypothetical protein